MYACMSGVKEQLEPEIPELFKEFLGH